MNERTVKEETKLIPYGMMNFVAIREDNFYYVDKTRFIEKIEQSNKYIFFYRPRRPHTQLHKVYVIYRGVEMVACEEV